MFQTILRARIVPRKQHALDTTVHANLKIQLLLHQASTHRPKTPTQLRLILAAVLEEQHTDVVAIRRIQSAPRDAKVQPVAQHPTVHRWPSPADHTVDAPQSHAPQIYKIKECLSQEPHLAQRHARVRKQAKQAKPRTISSIVQQIMLYFPLYLYMGDM